VCSKGKARDSTSGLSSVHCSSHLGSYFEGSIDGTIVKSSFAIVEYSRFYFASRGNPLLIFQKLFFGLIRPDILLIMIRLIKAFQLGGFAGMYEAWLNYPSDWLDDNGL